MSGDRLPEFIVIGAVKAATTWIAHHLRQNPAIYMPGPEPHFFSSEYDRGSDWYRSLFAEASPEQMIGEKSADYFAHPLAAERMAALLPDIPLVLQLRNPIERAYSDYCMLFRRGTVRGSPSKYLLSDDSEVARFLQDGLYARHLSRFLDHYPRERILIVLYDDIRAEPERVIHRVCDHIGAPRFMVPQDLRSRKNDSEAAMLPLPLRKLLRPAKGVVQPMRNAAWFKRLHGAMASPPRYPPLTEELRHHLSDYYREDVERLGTMIGRDLGRWLSVESSVAA